MYEFANVVASVDDENRIVYVEEKSFALGSEEVEKAREFYNFAEVDAQVMGYQIKKNSKKYYFYE